MVWVLSWHFPKNPFSTSSQETELRFTNTTTNPNGTHKQLPAWFWYTDCSWLGSPEAIDVERIPVLEESIKLTVFVCVPSGSEEPVYKSEYIYIYGSPGLVIPKWLGWGFIGSPSQPLSLGTESSLENVLGSLVPWKTGFVLKWRKETHFPFLLVSGRRGLWEVPAAPGDVDKLLINHLLSSFLLETLLFQRKNYSVNLYWTLWSRKDVCSSPILR